MATTHETHSEHSAAARSADVALEVKLWTVRKKITQKRLSQLLELPQSSISARLNGKKPFSIDELYLISDLMELSLVELIGSRLVNEKNPHPADGGSSEVSSGRGTRSPDLTIMRFIAATRFSEVSSPPATLATGQLLVAAYALSFMETALGGAQR